MDRDFEHPHIIEYNRKGYLGKEPEAIGTDFFGNEIFEGEEIFILDDERFLAENISGDLKEYLIYIGAKRKEANEF